MTGIETAIILIAFVIVAASFAFVVLNMGFFTAQRSKTVIASGLSEASSAVETDGSVIAYGVTSSSITTEDGQYTYSYGTEPDETIYLRSGLSDGFISKIVIYIKLSSGRQPVELNPDKLVITYTNNYVSLDNIYANNGTYARVTQVVGDGDALLEEGEKFKIEIYLLNISRHLDELLPDYYSTLWVGGGLGEAYVSAPLVGPHDTFIVEIKPPVGAILTVERMIPPSIDTVMNLG